MKHAAGNYLHPDVNDELLGTVFESTLHSLNSLQQQQYYYIETEPDLEKLQDRMRQAARIALDTEADSLHHYFEKVCLIQLTLDGTNYIIDPLSGIDLSQFLSILTEKPLIFHGADYDLRMLRATFLFHPKRDVFDTMLAAQLLGYEQFGLAALVQRFFGTTLTKSGQKSDWSRRPLRSKQLEYASNDTRFLEPLAIALHTELQELGRWEWYRETCARMVESTLQNNVSRDSENAWRIKGWSALDRRQLAFLRQIWIWREQEAQKVDLPPFRVMNNQQIIDLAIWVSSHPNGPLTDGPKLPRHLKGRRLVRLQKTIRKAQKIPESQWPEIRRPKFPPHLEPDLKQIIENLQTECSKMAEALNITSPSLAPRAALVAIARNRPANLKDIMACGLMRWQATLLEPRVRQILKEFT